MALSRLSKDEKFHDYLQAYGSTQSNLELPERFQKQLRESLNSLNFFLPLKMTILPQNKFASKLSVVGVSNQYLLSI